MTHRSTLSCDYPACSETFPSLGAAFVPTGWSSVEFVHGSTGLISHFCPVHTEFYLAFTRGQCVIELCLDDGKYNTANPCQLPINHRGPCHYSK